MKIYKPAEYSFICALCQQAQSVRLIKCEYSIYDKHCKYSIKFTAPRLVRLSPKIATHKGKQGFWQCPACEGLYRLQETEGGFVVRDDNCGAELLISSGSPLLH